jgi:excinuclease ABC subunit A
MSIYLVSTMEPPVWGYGNIIGIDAELVIPNTTLSIYENAISLESDSMSWFRDELVNNAYKFEFQFINLIIN